MSQVLMRVQPNFIGLNKKNDVLSLTRVGDTYRNTIHFCVNGIVSSHESGNWDNCGIIIVCHPEEVDAPISGARLEDTWFHVGNTGLNIGSSAKILVPEGIEIPKELESFVKFYPNGETEESKQKAKREAVSQVLDEFGVKDKYQIGRNSVFKDGKEISFSDYLYLCDELKTKFNLGGPAKTDQHMNTEDSQLEDLIPYLKGQLNYMKTVGMINVKNGVSYSVDKDALETIEKSFKRIDVANDSLNGYADHYYDRLKTNLKEIQESIVEIQKDYEKPYELISQNGNSGRKNEQEVIEFINNLAKNKENHVFFDQIMAVDRTLYDGEKDRELGVLSESFDYEVRKAKITNLIQKNNVVNNIENVRCSAIPPPLPCEESIRPKV